MDDCSTVKEDCFAYSKDGICKILTERLCENGHCSFYKTKKQYEMKIPNLPYEKKPKPPKKEKTPERFIVSHY